jgi:hypothetical protein
MTMTQKYLSCLGPQGFHRAAYIEWGAAAGRPTLRRLVSPRWSVFTA